MSASPTTVIEGLASSLESASAHNSNDTEKPISVLWMDRDAQWQPLLPRLQALMPQLLVHDLDNYRPEDRVGPSIWLRCVVDRALELPGLSGEMTPIVYLPGVSRQELGSAETCPSHLKPLVELQYRGTCWTQKNGKDWTVEAFMVSKDGGLDLDVARDTATRKAMLRALAELAATSVQALRGRRLESEDFDRLLSDDPIRDVLVWLSDPDSVSTHWEVARQDAFKSRCRSDFGFDPDEDGAIPAAERLGHREGLWSIVWSRFAEAPALYPGIPEWLRKAMPKDLFLEDPSTWPQCNDKDETDLRRLFAALEGEIPSAARRRVVQLERLHGRRREWVWAKLDRTPLANALAHLVEVAELTSKDLGGASPTEMAARYAAEAWMVDAAALRSFASVKSSADMNAVRCALQAIYRPWLESAALHLQALAEQQPLPRQREQDKGDVLVDAGGLVLFADGLRFDVSQRLVERLKSRGHTVEVTTRWAAHPSVTATAKPAVSPISELFTGATLGADFLPVDADTGRTLSASRFRKLLDGADYQVLSADDTGDPSGRGWTEYGELDKLGHSLQGKLAARIDDQIVLLLERIESLLHAGWTEVRVVTDHGWLWLSGGLPKVNLPEYLTENRWSRCAAIAGESTVQVPTVPWYWNVAERVALAPGIACFVAGNEYAHGGLSLQESLIPVLRVSSGVTSFAVSASIVAVDWVGLRCRVRIEPAREGFSVDLRTRVNDADSSISGARPIGTKGAASLLVADDDLEGTSAAVVVLDGGGQVIARQSTIIGGEG